MASVAKKKISYVPDLKTLLADVNNAEKQNTNTLAEPLAAKTSSQPSINNSISINSRLDTKFNDNDIVGLNVQIPRELRDRLKMMAISKRLKVKELVVEILAKYMAESN